MNTIERYNRLTASVMRNLRDMEGIHRFLSSDTRGKILEVLDRENDEIITSLRDGYVDGPSNSDNKYNFYDGFDKGDGLRNFNVNRIVVPEYRSWSGLISLQEMISKTAPDDYEFVYANSLEEFDPNIDVGPTICRESSLSIFKRIMAEHGVPCVNFDREAYQPQYMTSGFAKVDGVVSYSFCINGTEQSESGIHREYKEYLERKGYYGLVRYERFGDRLMVLDGFSSNILDLLKHSALPDEIIADAVTEKMRNSILNYQKRK